MGEIDFVVLKINGVSAEQFSENAAVETFLKSNEPIQIEVQQRQTLMESSGHSILLSLRCPSNDECLRSNSLRQTKETQTDIISSCEASDCTDRETTEATALESSNGHLNIVCSNVETEQHVLFDQCLAPEIDIEEVTLRKSSSNEFLGLSIIYSGADGGSKTNSGESNNGGSTVGSGSENNNDVCTEVFISHIQDDSVASRDGRLRQGDQILQINGKDIKTKEETETLMAENYNAVTLLVSRYLYTDDDDFNDPSLEVDLEVEEVEEAENDENDNDETDDEGEEELYVANPSTYENCFATNKSLHIVNNFEKVILTQEKLQNMQEKLKSLSEANEVVTKSVDAVISKTINSDKDRLCKKSMSSKCNDLNYRNLTTQSRQKTSKNVGMLNMKFCGNSSHSSPVIEVRSTTESETEHIYETIPEDSEPEPFYCSPYESSTYVNAIGTCSSSTSGEAFQLQQRQKQRVAQWLGLCTPASSGSILFPRRTIPLRAVNRSCSTPHEPHLNGRGNNKSDCVREVVNAANHQDEQDNSSSAYNTGGSNASANQIRHEALSLPRTTQEDSWNTPLIHRTNPKRSQIPKEKDKPNSKVTNCAAHGIGKIGNNIQAGSDDLTIPETLIRMYPPLEATQSVTKKLFNKEAPLRFSNKAQQPSTDHLPRTVSMLCPHFTAPSLRQYHFVSSQEVSTSHIGTSINYITAKSPQNIEKLQTHQPQPSMVWKVKRRPDGTRYIVRRPAVAVVSTTASASAVFSRNRVLRNPDHPNIRNDMTTTEDDTISEVKTGRYWPKEERKKHVERARERRLQQQQQLQLERQMVEGATIRISDKMIARLQQHRKQRQKHQVLRIQHQDLQFGGSSSSKQTPSTIVSDFPASTVGTTKLPSTTSKLNSIAQHHHFTNSQNDDHASSVNTTDENYPNENCSSP